MPCVDDPPGSFGSSKLVDVALDQRDDRRRPPTPPRRSRSWILIVVGAAVLAVAIASLMAVKDLGGSDVRTVDDVRTDVAALDRLTELLWPLRDELDGITPFDGVDAAPADLVGCTVDSGDLFQPRVRRTWLREPTRAALDPAPLVEALERRGWEVQIVDRFGTTQLVMQVAAHTAVAEVYAASAGGTVGVEITIDDAAPCSFS
jgi:hypothetical protein